MGRGGLSRIIGTTHKTSSFNNEIKPIFIIITFIYKPDNLKKIIKCDECLGAIVAVEKFPGFIAQKDVGGLHYPSQDVVNFLVQWRPAISFYHDLLET